MSAQQLHSTYSDGTSSDARRGRRERLGRCRRVELRSPAVPKVFPLVSDVPASSYVTVQVVSAGPSALASDIVISGLCFALGVQYVCAIIIRRDGIVDVRDVDGGRVVG